MTFLSAKWNYTPIRAIIYAETANFPCPINEYISYHLLRGELYMFNLVNKILGKEYMQVAFIFISFGIAIWAKELMADLSHVSFSMFIATGFKNMIKHGDFGVWKNALFPSILYIFSCIFLFWIAILNIKKFKSEESTLNKLLIIFLGLAVLFISIFFLISAYKSLIFGLGFIFIILFLGWLLTGNKE